MKLGVLGAVLLIPAIASADHPRQYIDVAGQAPEFGFVAATRGDGLALARQVLPMSQTPVVSGISDGPAKALALSRIVYLNKGGVTLLRPRSLRVPAEATIVAGSFLSFISVGAGTARPARRRGRHP